MRINSSTKGTEAKISPSTYGGGVGSKIKPLEELRRSVLTCMLFENTFYEKGSDVADRIKDLVTKNKPQDVALLAREARDRMNLRHTPLFLIRELARMKGNGPLVAETLEHCIQRASDLTDFMALYFKDGKQPLSAGVKRGLAKAFNKFNAYHLAKYDRKETVKLRDVLFLSHPKPKDDAQKLAFDQLASSTLPVPDTWETALSSGANKKETWERLLSEGKLGGLAVLRNLRNMQNEKVDETLIRTRLTEGIAKAMPYRFIAAAKYAPTLEDSIEQAMFKASEGMEPLSGTTAILVDVSGSMDYVLSAKSDMNRLDAASALSIYLREKSGNVKVGTFSFNFVEVAPRRGFALSEAISSSQSHGGTALGNSLKEAKEKWGNIDRLIVVTDEQSSDKIIPWWGPKDRAYIVNVAPYSVGVGYKDGYIHINGWSEAIIDYILETEKASY